MISMKKLITYLPLVLLTTLFAACGDGGGGGGDTVSQTGTGISTGVLVDPYIVGAQLEEVGPDGQPIQASLAVTSSTGRFEFQDEIKVGSTVRTNASMKGMHANEDYEGILKRQVSQNDEGPIIISPLTTLAANGMSPGAILQMLNSAGLTGLDENDIYADPMAALVDKTGNVTEADLTLLQANLATNVFMTTIGNFNYGGVATAAVPPVNFDDCAAVVREVLNPTVFQQMTAAIGSDFTVGDLASTAARVTGSVVAGIKQEIADGSQKVSFTTMKQLMNGAMADAETIAGNFYHSRTGSNGGDGGSNPPATGDPVNGESIFTAKACTDCHTVGSGSGTMDLANDGAKLTSEFVGGSSHKGRTLDAAEITDVAAYLNASSGDGGSTPPPSDGGGGSNPPATGDRIGQEVFDQECAGCHAMGSHDTTSVYGDLAGMGSAIIPKVEANHQSKLAGITSAELTNLADFADTFAPPSGGGGGSVGGSCDSCHGYPETSGAHTVHLNLNGVSCDSCHLDNIQNGNHNNGWVDLDFPAELDAASGVATDNGDGTCSNIICHGGQETPEWSTGSINVNTDCRSCHANRAGQYNDYNSGEHSKHVNSENVSCVTCHDTATLASGGHFSGLDTSSLEQSPASTIKSSLSYSNSSCIGCHHSRRSPNWF